MVEEVGFLNSCLGTWGISQMKDMPSAPFPCPHCGTVYRIVRVEMPAVAREREITCLSCGGPLAGREGAFILKYFRVDTASERQRRTK